MAIENLGLVLADSIDNALKKTGGSSLKVSEADGSSLRPYIRFRTLSGTDINTGASVTVEWCGVEKATAARPGTSYSTTWESEWRGLTDLVTDSDVKVQEIDGGYEWAILLTRIAPLENFTDTSWSFANRRYDELHFRVGVQTTFALGITGADGGTVSPLAQCDAWLGYFPTYSIESVAYDLDSLDIRFERSSTWHRADDRWCVEELTIAGNDALPGDHSVWGTIRNGEARIPLDQLAVLPTAGDAHIRIRLNASFKSIGYNLATCEGDVVISDETECNTPTLTPFVNGDHVYVVVGDKNDRNRPITTATVKLRGSSYPCDTVTVPIGGAAEFFVLPKGVHTIEAIATDDDEGTDVSKTASVTVTIAESLPARIHDIESGASIAVEFDPSFSWTGNPEMETVKLSGRRRESVWYGVGGSSAGSISLSIIGDDGCERAEALSWFRACLLKTPDGIRKLIAVEGVNYNLAFWGSSVNLNYREVV